MPFLCLKPFNDPLRSCPSGTKSLKVLLCLQLGNSSPLPRPTHLPPVSFILLHWPLSPGLPVSLQFLTWASFLLLGLLPTIPFPWKDTWQSLSLRVTFKYHLCGDISLTSLFKIVSLPHSPSAIPGWHSQSPFAAWFIPTALITIWHSICFTYFIVYCLSPPRIT